jgi:hypothetical protein
VGTAACRCCGAVEQRLWLQVLLPSKVCFQQRSMCRLSALLGCACQAVFGCVFESNPVQPVCGSKEPSVLSVQVYSGLQFLQHKGEESGRCTASGAAGGKLMQALCIIAV